MNNTLHSDILRLLAQTVHPEKNKDIVSLGWIENLTADNNSIAFVIHFPSQRDPFANALKQQCERLLNERFPSCAVSITLQFAEHKKQAAPPSAAEALSGVKHIVGIMSGKGGVGKSTIAVNLAVGLAERGYRVGLVDADIYGPSLPKMFGAEDERPFADKDDIMIPLQKYGVKMLSVGFFVTPSDALIWRAPIVVSALKQLLLQARWGDLDFLFVDMPPGTGDIHLTLVGDIPLTGAVVVGTPQQVALADVVKSISFLQNKAVNVKIIGLVENMAYFVPPELPQNRYYIFGKEGVKTLAQQMNLPLLAEIPIVEAVCESGDAGVPLVLQECAAKISFEQMTEQFLRAMDNLAGTAFCSQRQQ